MAADSFPEQSDLSDDLDLLTKVLDSVDIDISLEDVNKEVNKLFSVCFHLNNFYVLKK